MRMGFNWAPAYQVRVIPVGEEGHRQYLRVACCPDCGYPVRDLDRQDVQEYRAQASLERNQSALVSNATRFVESGARQRCLKSVTCRTGA